MSTSPGSVKSIRQSRTVARSNTILYNAGCSVISSVGSGG